MGSFLRRLILFFSIAIVFFGLASYYLIKNNNEEYQFLYRYQLDKIKQTKQISTLFVGDSSLGNAIDSDEFSRLSSQSSINCALTGLYGYEGSYNILKIAHKYHPEIENVVIMQTLDMQTRPLSYAGYMRTTNSANDFMELSIREKIYFVREFSYYVKSIRLNYSANKEKIIENDYIQQAQRKDVPYAYVVEELNIGAINPEKNKFLARIVKYCRNNNLNLIYINGPIHEEIASRSDSYVDTANKIISETGVQLVSDIVSIKENDLGDSVDHIRPDLKKEYTIRYYELVKKYLKNRNERVAM
ncbi:MAG: hypothetical protein QG620_443 [Patescibacteria group bacterium]|nr:hypothetical protein [Patescibacteria group bacterium]